MTYLEILYLLFYDTLVCFDNSLIWSLQEVIRYLPRQSMALHKHSSTFLALSDTPSHILQYPLSNAVASFSLICPETSEAYIVVPAHSAQSGQISEKAYFFDG
jgi:hypothetical protein